MADNFEGLTVTIDADAAPLRRELTEASRLGRDLGRSMSNAFEAAALRGRGLRDVVRGLVRDLSSATLRAAMRPVGQALGQSIGGLLAGTIGFARGGVLTQAMPAPFAQGGVIGAPVAFPLAGGRTGLAGEAGPEAILPLARGADGRLGVRAQGVGQPVSVTFHVTATDADSFRRSEAQITAMLARAVARGQRGL